MNGADLRRMERLGLDAMQVDARLAEEKLVSPYEAYERFEKSEPHGFVRVTPPVDRTAAWIRMSRTQYEKDRVMLEYPDGSTYSMGVVEAEGFLRKMKHPDPESFLAFVKDFLDAIWFVRENIFHPVTERDKRRWAWELSPASGERR